MDRDLQLYRGVRSPIMRRLLLLCTWVVLHEFSSGASQVEPQSDPLVEPLPVPSAPQQQQQQHSVTKGCARAPECEPRSEVVRKFGYTGEYDADKCCHVHSLIRDAVPLIVAALHAWNITCFLDSGSVIGVRRHDGRQIPWDYDSDIGFLIDGDAITLSNWRTVIAKVVASLGPTFAMTDTHPAPPFSAETLEKAGVPMDGSVGRGYCAQIQVWCFGKGIQVDLFGYAYTDYVSYEAFVRGERKWPKQYDGRLDDSKHTRSRGLATNNGAEGNGVEEAQHQHLRHVDTHRSSTAVRVTTAGVGGSGSGSGSGGGGDQVYVWKLGQCFSNHYRAGRHIFPRGRNSLGMCPFYDTMVPCPGDIDHYLTDNYGPDVLNNAVGHDETYELANVQSHVALAVERVLGRDTVLSNALSRAVVAVFKRGKTMLKSNVERAMFVLSQFLCVVILACAAVRGRRRCVARRKERKGSSQMGEEGQDGVLDAEDLLFPKGRSGGGEDLSMRVRVGRK